jgi:hypothetical protein
MWSKTTEVSPGGRGVHVALIFLLGFLLWLLNHPYQGIWHDARIYGLLAAHWLKPEALDSDLFFSYGSQSSFSLFTPVYGMLVGWLGLDATAWGLTVAGSLLWIGASLALARRMLGDGFAAWFVVLLGSVLVVSYSPNGDTFVLGENFATARSLAVPLALASVAALGGKRGGWSLALALAAMALHPLHGVWAVALWVSMRMRTTMVLYMALAAVAVVALLGVVNPDLPHVRLMTGQWLGYALEAAPDVVFKSPAQNRLPFHLGTLLVLWLGMRLGTEGWRPMYQRLLALGIAGLGMALVASYLFPVELVVQAQPWRVMALLLPLAAVGMVDIARQAWRTSVPGRLLVGAIAVLASIDIDWLLPVMTAVAVASLFPGRWVDGVEEWTRIRQRWLGGALALVALSVVPTVVSAWVVAGNQWLKPWWHGMEWLQGLVAGGTWHVAAILALVLAGLQRAGGTTGAGRGSGRGLVMILALALVAAAVAATLPRWDRRAEFQRVAQACYLDEKCPPHPFRRQIASGSVVFWPERELTVWFELRTASYFGEIQSTGKVFSPGKFYEWQRRQAWVAGGRDPRHLCGDPVIDWLVLPHPVAGLSPRAVFEGEYLFACADLRTVPAATSLQGRSS